MRIYLLWAVFLISMMTFGYYSPLWAREALSSENKGSIRIEFETKYQAWKEYISQSGLRFLSRAKPPLSSIPEYQEIIDLGVPALPYIIEKIEQDRIDGRKLFRAVEEIAKVKIRGKYDKDKKVVVFPDFPNVKAGESVYVYWWKEGRACAAQQSEKFYQEWKELNQEGKEAEAKAKYQRMIDSGVAALPYMLEKVKQGDVELVPAISVLTDNKVKKDAKQSECLEWWEKNKEKWLIPFPNKQPTANAGPDQNVTSGDVVQLDGSASSDPDKDELAYKWMQIAGPSVTLSDDTAVKPVFTAPAVEQETVLTFQLIVNDGSSKKSASPSCESGQSEPDTVGITVKPKAAS